ncbi:hypothetical protein ACPOL_3887 [Acidisarcina polymorpha]|uniref:Uncharacterized protein n=1 Tax=Acidisarcina polymorpha TaxID=2211140 RepID=A0A2Z5G3R5_9BACT|nr:hypothetical protein [Acidisarcina polymorpha]AXC13166.1 hypothetical protein ACPOL_3887 [Acidisarcina polymorpha]
MTTNIETSLSEDLGAAARQAGLQVLSVEAGSDFHGQPTARFQLALTADASPRHSLLLELSDRFDFHQKGSNGEELLPAMTLHLQESASRLRNPRPDAYVTVAGLPISLGEFAWPFHRSTSGSDNYVVHGVVRLEDGQSGPGVVAPLHAKISASMTVTFAEIVPAPEQPYAETFIYNAVRKTLDYGQLELVKSGNRQPVPVTTRYYSRWQKKFFFTDTDSAIRTEFLKSKIYWLSGVLGGSDPVWVADPRDAQYLNTTADELKSMVTALEREGYVKLTADYAAPTARLLDHAEEFKAKLDAALLATRPAFNEEMRHGHTNM